MSDVGKISTSMNGYAGSISKFTGVALDATNNTKQIDSNVSMQQISTEEIVLDVPSSIKNIGTGMKEFIEGSANFLEETGAKAVDNIKNLGDNNFDATWEQMSDSWDNNIVPILTECHDVLGEFLENTMATVALAGTSLVEGLFQFGESLVDLGSIIITSGASLITGTIDLGQAIWGAITGQDWVSITSLMWEDTKSFVAKDFVTSWFDSMYENTSFGQFLKENAYGFDFTRNLFSGLGYIAGNVILTICTGGLGSSALSSSARLAMTASAGGMGKGTQNAWSNGADIFEGLIHGAANGLWEGFQFYIGGKIGGMNLFGDGGKFLTSLSKEQITTKLLNSLSRIVLDGVDGGIEAFVQPVLQDIYKEGSYKELFEESGGWQNFLTQFLIGGLGSSVGEVFDIGGKFFNNKTDVDVNNKVFSDLEIENKLNRYNELLAIVNSKEYIEYSQGWDCGELNEYFFRIQTEFRQLEAEFHDIMNSTSNLNSKVIELNKLEDIELNDLEQMPSNAIFKTNDGNTFTYNSLKKILTNSSELKKNLVLSAINIEDPVLKARKLYIELNKKVHYSMEWIIGSDEIKKSILSENITFDNLNPYNTIICQGWSELYADLLKSCGFEELNVKIVNSGIHKWVEIDLGNGYILSADATDAMNGSIDLASCKAGMQTNGFMMFKDDYSGMRLKEIYENKLANANFINEQQKYFKNIDSILGYVGDDGYLLDEISKANELFADNKMYDQIFNDVQLSKNINTIFDAEIPKDMDGYEVFAFNKLYSNKLLGNNAKLIKQETMYRFNSDMVEPVNYMYCHDENIFQIYSSSLGKQRFDSLEAAMEYIKYKGIFWKDR